MRTVEYRNEPNRARQLALESRQQSAHRCRHLNCIRASLTGNGENDDRSRRFKIANEKVARQAFVLNAINDTGDIPQIDGRAVWPPFYDQIAIAFRRLELPLRLQRKGFVFAIELARAGISG